MDRLDMKRVVASTPSKVYRISKSNIVQRTDRAIQVPVGQGGHFPIRYKIWIPTSFTQDTGKYIVVRLSKNFREMKGIDGIDDIIESL